MATDITPEDKVYTGRSDKLRKDLTLEEVNAILVSFPDSTIYPPVPEGITFASAEIEHTTHFKRPPITDYAPGEVDVGIVKQDLDETLIMERVSKLNHLNIVQHLAGRVRRGFLTGFYTEELPQTLLQYCDTPQFKELDRDKVYEGVESAIRALHGIGLPHNDIYPGNIMIKDGNPVLIDFGSCRRVGELLRSCGSPGWCKEDFCMSGIEHDEFSLGVLRRFLEDQNSVKVFDTFTGVTKFRAFTAGGERQATAAILLRIAWRRP